MINSNIAQIPPYPAIPRHSQEKTRRQHEFEDLHEGQGDGGNQQLVRGTGTVSIPAPMIHGSQQGLKFAAGRVGTDMIATAGGRPRRVSNAQVLMQLIDQMGGSGTITGPGRLLDIVA